MDVRDARFAYDVGKDILLLLTNQVLDSTSESKAKHLHMVLGSTLQG